MSEYTSIKKIFHIIAEKHNAKLIDVDLLIENVWF